jgi:hypothetical protein
VIRSARERLLEAADPAAAALIKLLRSDDEAIVERAARAILDRAGHGASSSVEVETSIKGLTLSQLREKARDLLILGDGR